MAMRFQWFWAPKIINEAINRGAHNKNFGALRDAQCPKLRYFSYDAESAMALGCLRLFIYKVSDPKPCDSSPEASSA